MVNCQKCGARVEADDLFCPDCGAKVKSVTEEPQKTPTFQTWQKPQKLQISLPQQSHWGRKLIWTIVIVVVILYFIGKYSTTTETQISPLPYNAPPYVPPQDVVQPNIQPQPPIDYSSMEEEKKIAEEKAKEEKAMEEDKYSACSGVYAKIESTCWSCGLVSCGLFAKVTNTGSKPILAFLSTAYTNAVEKDEGRVYEPIDVGASRFCDIFAVGTDIRMIELIPIVMSNGQEVSCDHMVISTGNAYGEPFSGECTPGFSEI